MICTSFFIGCGNKRDDTIQENTAPVESKIILPEYFKPIDYPKDNPFDSKKVALGEKMFNDTRLSRDNSVACASCHIKEYAFSDTVQFSVGIDSQIMERNSPPLFNLFTHNAFFRDGGSPTLELQAIGPIEAPEEMDLNIVELCEKLNQIDEYKIAAQKLYDSEVTPFVIGRSIANYMRSLNSHHSRYDAYLQGNQSALSETEQKGLELFEGKAKCINCHYGGDLRSNNYYNIGLYEHYIDSGLARITLKSSDAGKFKVPSLRNIAITGPYMHNGSLNSLEEVIEHFNLGGEPHPQKTELIQPLYLNKKEKRQLLEFLIALTDTSYQHH